MADVARRPLAIAACGAAVAVGALLRLWNLSSQVLSGDEFHALFAAIAHSPADILFRYQESDNCIPLTLLDRWLFDAGVPVTELHVRLPAVVSGLALMALAPLWAWRRLGPGVAVALAWLVAISPPLVLYTRIARSYAPATLLCFLAVAACEAWNRRGGYAAAAGYVVAAVGATWFHLGAAPLALAPLVVPWTGVLARRGRASGRVVALTGAVALALVALLAPAHATLLPLTRGKSGDLLVSPASAIEVASWLAGSPYRWIAVAFWTAFTVGVWRLWRRDRRLAGFVATAVAGQVAGIVVLAPLGNESPVILGRYVVMMLPWVLIAVAAGVAAKSTPTTGRLRAWLTPTAVATLAIGGPFLDSSWWRTSFPHNEVYLRYAAARPALPPHATGAYRWIRGRHEGAILELPWDAIWSFERAFALYQQLHDREVVVSAWTATPGLAFRNMTDDRPEALLASRARWLFVHRAIIKEELLIGPWPDSPPVRFAYNQRGRRIINGLHSVWGPPDYRDDWIWVWDLDRVRHGRRRDPGAQARITGARAHTATLPP